MSMVEAMQEYMIPRFVVSKVFPLVYRKNLNMNVLYQLCGHLS